MGCVHVCVFMRVCLPVFPGINVLMYFKVRPQYCKLVTGTLQMDHWQQFASQICSKKGKFGSNRVRKNAGLHFGDNDVV